MRKMVLTMHPVAYPRGQQQVRHTPPDDLSLSSFPVVANPTVRFTVTIMAITAVTIMHPTLTSLSLWDRNS